MYISNLVTTEALTVCSITNEKNSGWVKVTRQSQTNDILSVRVNEFSMKMYHLNFVITITL